MILLVFDVWFNHGFDVRTRIFVASLSTWSCCLLVRLDLRFEKLWQFNNIRMLFLVVHTWLFVRGLLFVPSALAGRRFIRHE